MRSLRVSKYQAKYHQWLEAHEMYEINHKKGTVTFTHLVALCHSCHNFTHSGRMFSLFQKREIEEEKIREIMYHGLTILRDHRLKPPIMARYVELHLKGIPDHEITVAIYREYKVPEPVPWGKWRMIIYGKPYASLFENVDKWAEHYSAEREYAFLESAWK